MTHSLILIEVTTKSNRDWIDYVSAVGSIATLFAFLYLFRNQHINSKVQLRTETEYNDQQERNNLQQFESSLFNLIGLHNQIISNLTYHQSGITEPDQTGRDVFNKAKMKLELICKSGNTDRLTARQVIEENYVSQYYQSFEHILNHYFRNLYHIFKYIETSTLILDSKKSNYSSIVRAQLSQNELYTIMFNLMIQDYGYPKFILLSKKYNILKNFRHSSNSLKPFFELYKEMESTVSNKKDTNGLKIKIDD